MLNAVGRERLPSLRRSRVVASWTSGTELRFLYPESHMAGESSSGRPKVAALVGLCLLEVIRARDLPTEILEAEDPSQTMPRRLGLSEAVEQQIRRFRMEAKKRGRITDEEMGALFGLVLKRPDAREVFFQAGELLAGKDVPAGGPSRWLPRRMGYALARREFRKRFRALFGRSLGGFAHGPFSLEAPGHLLLDMDPRGHACALLSGFAETILVRRLRAPVRVTHPTCVGAKHEICHWQAVESRD